MLCHLCLPRLRSVRGIKAYHGSPVDDINEFDLNHYLTGEGGGAFGYGIHVSNNQLVGSEYARPDNKISVNGEMVYPNSQIYRAANSIIKKGYDSALEEAVKYLNDRPDNSAFARNYVDKVKSLKNANVLPLSSKGKVYDVEVIANDDQLILWDEPIHKQSKTVRDAFYAEIDEMDPNSTGGDLYQYMSETTFDGDDKATSKLLSDWGIKGAKYKNTILHGVEGKDAQSGNMVDAEEAYNYSIFDTENIKINRISPEAPKGIKAYHGSPQSFDRFSTEYIDTGEGAQQYGRGLYFAENEKVAKEYRDQLTPRDLDYEDWLMGKYKDAESNQDYARMEMYERAMLNETPQDFKDLAADVDYDEDYRGLAAEVGEEIEEYGPDLGSMYEVNIDVEPDELLDWYQPISQQSKKVRDAVYANSDAVDQKIVDDYFYGDRNNIVNDEMYGMRYMSNMDQINAGTIGGTEYELAEKGVKGIRYADAFTRHKSPDKQSMNYVIFDDRLITIAKKYGVAIPVAAAMLARATGEDTSQSFQEET